MTALTIRARLWYAAILLACVGGLLFPSSAFAGGVVIVVDADGHASRRSCEADRAAIDTIQAAIDVATAGTTILVCPGSYQESLTIGPSHTGVTLRSTERWRARILGPSSEQSTIAIDGARGITVDGFALIVNGQIGERGCLTAFAGISVENDASATIVGNRIDRHETCGYLWGIVVRGSEATVAANVVRDFWIGGIGFLPSADETRPQGTIAGNRIRYAFRNFDDGSAVPGDAPTVNGDGIVVIGGSATRVVANEVRATARHVTKQVHHLGFGILVDPVGGAGPEIRSNSVTGVMTNGIVVGFSDDPVRDALVAANEIRGAKLFGLLLLGLRRSTIGDNVVADGGTGIYASESRNNEFLGNDARANAQFDCLDDSAGTRTAGTANRWVGNLGQDSSPLGICS